MLDTLEKNEDDNDEVNYEGILSRQDRLAITRSLHFLSSYNIRTPALREVGYRWKQETTRALRECETHVKALIRNHRVLYRLKSGYCNTGVIFWTWVNQLRFINLNNSFSYPNCDFPEAPVLAIIGCNDPDASIDSRTLGKLDFVYGNSGVDYGVYAKSVSTRFFRDNNATKKLHIISVTDEIPYWTRLAATWTVGWDRGELFPFNQQEHTLQDACDINDSDTNACNPGMLCYPEPQEGINLTPQYWTPNAIIAHSGWQTYLRNLSPLEIKTYLFRTIIQCEDSAKRSKVWHSKSGITVAKKRERKILEQENAKRHQDATPGSPGGETGSTDS